MRDFLIAMMSAMMPYMKYVHYLAELAVVAGLVLLVLNFVTGGQDARIRLAGKTLLWTSVFYLACAGMAIMLNIPAGVNFCQLWPVSMTCKTTFDLPTPHFLKIGIAALVIGSLYLLIGKRGEHSSNA